MLTFPRNFVKLWNLLPADRGGLTAVDVFYKEFYPLSGRALDAGPLTSDGRGREAFGLRSAVRLFRHKPKPIAGECGEVTFGGLPIAFRSIEPMLKDRQATRPLIQAISKAIQS